MSKGNHWADNYAERIVREKGPKDIYVCAAGITPSGTVHIGNFREVITVALVVQALRERGEKVRFIYSWDDYDVFRKVPVNMPDQENLERFLRQPITMTPDPYGQVESYARHNEVEVESLLPKVGIKPEFIYQAGRYRAGEYADGIRRALERRDTLRSILNEHRTTPLPDDWMPISIFCGNCHKDTTAIDDWDGEYGVGYRCESCGHQETIDLRSSPVTKLLWRIDWPMRWARENVDFEPAGKDHHSEGGSVDTGRKIVEQVYDAKAPISFQYDFIGIKGRGGKISSSTGDVVSLRDVLEIYQPEIVRHLFVGTRPNSEFSISFDLDVLKIYEDYDRVERIAFGIEEVSEQRREKERRIYELSQVDALPETIPHQARFRHLCNLLQIQEGNIPAVLEQLGAEAAGADLSRTRVRAQCAWNWIQSYAPEDFRFSLRAPDAQPLTVTDDERSLLMAFNTAVVHRLDELDEKQVAQAIYDVAEECEADPKELFRLIYRILIGKETGPRLAGFLLTIGRQRVGQRFQPYL